MKKRVLALVIGSAIAASALAGCGSSSNSAASTAEPAGEAAGEAEGEAAASTEVPVVKVCIPNYDSPADTDLVEGEINKIAGEKYGVNIDLEFIATGNWAQQTNLMLTSDEVDVLAIYGTPFSSFISNGQLLDLTDYWAGASAELKDVWSEDDLKPFQKDGKIYALPNFRDYGGYLGGMIDSDIAEEFGIEDDQELTWEELDEFLHAACEKYPDRYGLVPTGGTALISSWTWDGLGDSSYIGVLPNSGEKGLELVPLFEAEDFLNFVTYARKWYEDGITMPDILSNTESWRSMFDADKAIAAINSIGVNDKPGIYDFHLTPRAIGTDVYQSVSYGINSNSKNPDAAWAALQMLYTDKEIGTLLLNGVEGRNYVRNDDGSVSFPEGLDGSTAGYNLINAYWFVPYCPNGLPLDVNGGDFFEKLIQQKKDAPLSAAFGFAFDSSSVTDEYAACVNVMSKYYKALMSGAVDTESVMQQATEELEAAGMEKVIAEKQAQLDKWAENK